AEETGQTTLGSYDCHGDLLLSCSNGSGGTPSAQIRVPPPGYVTWGPRHLTTRARRASISEQLYFVFCCEENPGLQVLPGWATILSITDTSRINGDCDNRVGCVWRIVTRADFNCFTRVS